MNNGRCNSNSPGWGTMPPPPCPSASQASISSMPPPPSKMDPSPEKNKSALAPQYSPAQNKRSRQDSTNSGITPAKRQNWGPPPSRIGTVKTQRSNPSSTQIKDAGGSAKDASQSDAPIVPGCQTNRHVAILSQSQVPTNHKSPSGNISTEGETHIIFAIDFSGSMNTKDVTTTKSNGKCDKITRWDAVFECLKLFLKDQMQQSRDKADNGESPCFISLLIFNDNAKTLIERMPLVGDGAKALRRLDAARKSNKPKLGTGFSAGFRQASSLAASSKGNVVLVFLSDGRPGDLTMHPPKNANAAMQSNFRQKNKVYPAAGVHLEEMKQTHGNRFSLQLICIYEQGKSWLQYLAHRYQGTFHMSELNMDEEVVVNGNTGEHKDKSLAKGVKSQTTVVSERYNRAANLGNVRSIHGPTAASSTSMRTTFQSISSTVTAMRNESKRLVERQGVVLESSGVRSSMESFPATRMVLDADHEKILPAPGEASNERTVMLSTMPFAQGGLRNVYRMTEETVDGTRYFVGKESRHVVPYNQRLKFHCETSSCQATSATYAKEFNKALIEAKRSFPNAVLQQLTDVTVLVAEVYRLKDVSFSGGYRYLAVESEMKGTYEKYNSNNGYVIKSNSPEALVAQSFSHFSYEHSGQNEMVVDIQGSGFTYTDPQLHSKEKLYGRADRGTSGFDDFFKTHRCNCICEALGLQKRSSVNPFAKFRATQS